LEKNYIGFKLIDYLLRV